jgi:hypothetical protein
LLFKEVVLWEQVQAALDIQSLVRPIKQCNITTEVFCQWLIEDEILAALNFSSATTEKTQLTLTEYTPASVNYTKDLMSWTISDKVI